MAVMATVAKGYDLDYACRAVGEAYRGGGYYRAAAEAGEHRALGRVRAPSVWTSPRASRLSRSHTTRRSASGGDLMGEGRAGSGQQPKGSEDLPAPDCG